MWQVDQLLGNERETKKTKVMVRKQQQRNGVLCAIRAEMLYGRQIVRVCQLSSVELVG
jgi:hypothetical protein